MAEISQHSLSAGLYLGFQPASVAITRPEVAALQIIETPSSLELATSAPPGKHLRELLVR
jgi:hypothetical protein